MIVDPTKLQEVRDEWKIAIESQNSMRTIIDYYEKKTGGIWFNDFQNKVHALVLTFAFSVLEKTLKQLRKERLFKCKSDSLKHLMNESQSSNAMKWLDLSLVHEARIQRNKLVHEQKPIKREDTWKYIDAIEKELIGWKVLTGPAERWTYPRA